MRDFKPEEFVDEQIRKIKETVGTRKVLCALSGGVDSSVAAVLTQRAVGNALVCIFVDTGLMRKDEGDQVMEFCGKRFDMKIIRVNAADRFLGKLAGVTDPEQKRKIIGAEFISVFEEEAKKLTANEAAKRLAGEAGSKRLADEEESKRLADQKDEIGFLLQGTIYPDIAESGTDGKAVVKSHHNVGGLPEHMELDLLEPLKTLYKDEVRMVGEALGIAPELVWRQPFPGPGLAIRCLGEVNEEKLSILREADAIVREVIDKYNDDLYRKTGVRNSSDSVWQYFAILPDLKSVGVKDDARTYDHVIGVRAVKSVDAMTADWARLPHDVLETISNRILSEVKNATRVFYDLTAKPPGTIEWQ